MQVNLAYDIIACRGGNMDLNKLKYTPENYFKLYDIYSGIIVDENKIVSIEQAACLVGNFHQSFLKIDDNTDRGNKEFFYKVFLKNMIMGAKIDHRVDFTDKEIVDIEDMNKLKEIFYAIFDTKDCNALKGYFLKWLDDKGLDEVKEIFNYFNLSMDNLTRRESCVFRTYFDIKNYLDRYLKYIPEDILNTIDNVKLYALGYMSTETYNKFIEYKSNLKNWLEKPLGSNYKFKILSSSEENPLSNQTFHDNRFTFKYENDDLILNSLTFPGISFIFKKCKILNENFDYSLLDNIYEGYDYSIVKNVTNNTMVFALNFLDIVLYVETPEVIVDDSNFDEEKYLKEVFERIRSL